MNELTSLRTETGKTFELDPKLDHGQYALEARTGPIHYKESYAENEPWLDLDETYSEPGEQKEHGRVLVYPKMPNIVTVFQDKCGYQIQNRSYRDHIVTVELVAVDGNDVTQWIDDKDLRMYAKIHPYRVGIWKEFVSARTVGTTFKWIVTEEGKPGAAYPMVHKEEVEAWDSNYLFGVSEDSAKVAITTEKVRVSDSSFYLTEHAPKEAKIVDTDFKVAAGADDGDLDGTTFYPNNAWANLGKAASYSYSIWARFTNVTVEKNTVLASGSIIYTAFENQSGNNCNTILYLNNVDNASSPTNISDYNAKAVTTGVTLNSMSSWTSEQRYEYVITNDVQAILNRSGWSSGNAIMALHKNNSSSTNARRVILTYNGDTARCPKLSIIWGSGRGSRIYVPDVSWLSKSLLKRREI